MRITPTELWSWGGLIVFLVLYVVALFFIWRHRPGSAKEDRASVGAEKRNREATTDRIPLTRFRELARAAHWDDGPEDQFHELAKRLRQAARDGEVTFWGRNTTYDVGEEEDQTVLDKIPSEHFSEFGISAIDLADNPDNYDTHTIKPGHGESEFRGSNYRDIHIDEADAKSWLARNPGAPRSIEVELTDNPASLGGFSVLCAIYVKNIDPERREFKEAGFAKIDEISIPMPAGASLPFALRTEGQIKGGRNGRWTLSDGERKPVPILFAGAKRKNEWWLIDEYGKRYMLSPKSMRMLVCVYGLGKTVRALITIEKGPNWSARPSLEIVPDNYQWGSGDTEQLPDPRPDISVTDVFHVIGEHLHGRYDADKVQRVIIGEAWKGNLRIWGALQRELEGSSFEGATFGNEELIPREYWRTGQFDWGTFGGTERTKTERGQETYGRLRLNRQELERLLATGALDRSKF